MEPRREETSDSDNEIQFIEPVSMSGTFKPRNLKTPENNGINYENIGDRISGFISAFITVCLIICLYSTHLYFVFLPWMNSRVKEGYSDSDLFGISLWIGLGLMTAFVFMGLWSFTSALLSDNRVKPLGKAAKSRTSDSHELQIKRWCKKCNQEKPNRSHHCTVCNVCILKMDHHCPWINNCVGYRNHGHYLRFLFYVTLSMIMGLLLMAVRLSNYKGQYMYWGQKNGRFSIYLTDEMTQMAFLIADLVGCGILSLMIGLLFSVQIANSLKGHTTIESLEIKQCERDIRRQRRQEENDEEEEENEIPFPYNLGIENNLNSVFGENRWLWPFPLPIELNPLTGSSQNGRKFETRTDALMNGQWPLPSKDPLLLLKRRGSLDDGAGFIVKSVNYSLENK